MPAQLVAIQARDSNGDPVSGAKFYTYASGTSTPQAVYTDNALSVAASNPVVTDGYGRAAVWMNSSLVYKFTLKTADDATNLIPTIDNYTPRVDDILYLISVDTATALTAAQAAQAAAEAAQTAAELAETNAETAETNAETAETNASSSATAAASSATAAASSATAAAGSASTASTAATNAGNAQTAAETAETNAETAQTAAETAQGLAEAAAAATEGSATAAATSATAAAASATSADSSADLALARLAATTDAAAIAIGTVIGPASIIKSATTTAQPGSPSNGDTYIIPASATGAAWSTYNENDVARYDSNSGVWFADTPLDGWRAYVQDTNKTVTFDGSLWYNDAEPVFKVRAYGAVGDGTTDDAAAIQAAIDAAEAEGGGTVLFEAGTYKITTGLTVTESGVMLMGSGDGFFNASQPDNPTVILYDPASAGGDAITFSPVSGAGNTRIVGGGIWGISVDGNSEAENGIVINSCTQCDFAIAAENCTVAQIRLGTVAALAVARDLQECNFERINVSATGSAHGVYMQTDTSGANISYNRFRYIRANHINGTGAFFGNCDNIHVDFIRTFRASGTGDGVVLGSGDSANDPSPNYYHCRSSRFENVYSDSTIVAQGDADSDYATADNRMVIDGENASATPTVGTNAKIVWWSNKATGGPTRKINFGGGATNEVVFANDGGDLFFSLDADDAQTAGFRLRKDDVPRWGVNIATTEALNIARYNSSGVFQENSLAFDPSTGAATFNKRPNLAQAMTLQGASNLFSGSGAPESSVTANVGDFYFQDDAADGYGLWFKASGTGSTGWEAVPRISSGTYTPTIDFGGGSTGITYSAQVGNYSIIGDMMWLLGRIVLSNKGTDTGTAQISLPSEWTSPTLQQGVYIPEFGPATSVNNLPVGSIASGQSNIKIRHWASTTTANLTDANFNNTTAISFVGVVRY